MAFPTTGNFPGRQWTEFTRVWTYDGVGWAPFVDTGALSILLPERTLSQLLDAAADKDKAFRVLDAPGGEAIAYSDGTDYRRISDQSPVN